MDRKKIIFTFFVIPWASFLVAILPFMRVRADTTHIKNRISVEARFGGSSTQSTSIRVRTEVNGEVKENIEIYENQATTTEYKNIIQDETGQTSTRIEVREDGNSSSPDLFHAPSWGSEGRQNERNQLKAGPVFLEEKPKPSETSGGERIQASRRDEGVSSSASKSEFRRFQTILNFWQDMARRILSVFGF